MVTRQQASQALTELFKYALQKALQAEKAEAVGPATLTLLTEQVRTFINQED
jgi:hypothetical protein